MLFAAVFPALNAPIIAEVRQQLRPGASFRLVQQNFAEELRAEGERSRLVRLQARPVLCSSRNTQDVVVILDFEAERLRLLAVDAFYRRCERASRLASCSAGRGSCERMPLPAGSSALLQARVRRGFTETLTACIGWNRQQLSFQGSKAP